MPDRGMNNHLLYPSRSRLSKTEWAILEKKLEIL